MEAFKIQFRSSATIGDSTVEHGIAWYVTVNPAGDYELTFSI